MGDRPDKRKCVNCVWGRLEGDYIFCPVVMECWKEWQYPSSRKQDKQPDVKEDGNGREQT